MEREGSHYVGYPGASKPLEAYFLGWVLGVWVFALFSLHSKDVVKGCKYECQLIFKESSGFEYLETMNMFFYSFSLLCLFLESF